MQRTISPDVLVVGGGTAGFGAAYAAASRGARVRLIEGTSTIGGVMAFCPGMPWGGGFPIGRSIGGVFDTLTTMPCKMQPPLAEIRSSTLENFGHEVMYDHEAAVFAMFQMLEDVGVDVHLNTGSYPRGRWNRSPTRNQSNAGRSAALPSAGKIPDRLRLRLRAGPDE